MSELRSADPAEQRLLLFALGLATFMVSLDGRVVAPLLPTIAADFHSSVAQAGWLVSAYMLPYGFFQLAYGPVADRFGKVRVATYTMMAFSVGTALCGAFPSFGVIVALRALTGAAAAALIPLTIAYIGDTVPYARRQAALSMVMASAGAAQALSASAGGTLATLLSWRSVFPLLGGLACASSALLFAVRRREIRAPRAASGRPRYRDALALAPMRWLLGLVAVEGFLYMGGFPFLSGLLAQRFGLGAFEIGLVLGASGLSQLAGARLISALLRRLSETAMLALGGCAMASTFVISAFAPSVPWVVLGSLLSGFGFSICHSTLQTRATEAFARGRGTALALFAFVLFAGAALGTMCLGYAADWLGYGVTFGVTGVLLFVFTLLAVRVLGPAPRPALAPAEPS